MSCIHKCGRKQWYNIKNTRDNVLYNEGVYETAYAIATDGIQNYSEGIRSISPSTT